MVVHHARWVLPIAAPPIRDGWVAVSGDRVVAVGGPADPLPEGARSSRPVNREAEDIAIMPALVNAHTHLELSWMAGRVPPAGRMAEWIGRLMTLRREASPAIEEQQRAAAAALADARSRGTVAVGDIGNTLVALDVLRAAAMPSVFFLELIGFLPDGADRSAAEAAERITQAAAPPVRPGLAPHAPYSVAPDLFRALDRESTSRGLRSSVHLGESPEEVEFLATGGGAIAELLHALGKWNIAWRAPGLDPAAYLDSIGVLRPGLLTVHATQLGAGALARLAERGCVIVACPRSNRWVGVGDPPLDAFYASGAPVAFGTDSLASAPDLDMFGELAAARAISSVPPAALLESATRTGARALGLDDEYGTIEAGKRAALLAVRIRPGAADVEQYLVSGIDPADVRWIASAPDSAP